MADMKIVILNGAPDHDTWCCSSWIMALEAFLKQTHQVAVFTLHQMSISRCTGCFGCWVKTPGQCVVADDSHQLCGAYQSGGGWDFC
ncbi:MAG: hypothetical protein JXR76_10025 [Deltaproteobacteria bacterium]|nr:hypothetical protein [Deltaproteobacteria bacterium]